MNQLTILATAIVLLGAVNVWLIGRVLHLEKRTRHLYKSNRVIAELLTDSTRILEFLMDRAK
jgi:uncharacterized membrane protein YccC